MGRGRARLADDRHPAGGGEPSLRRGSAIHDAAFRALRDLQADFVRFVPWLPYPRLAVAALEPPRDDRTSWDFSLIDPLVIDFY